MTTRTTLLALASRVEAATAADREMGTRVIAAALAPANAFVEQSKINGAWCIYTADADGKNRSWQPPRGVRGVDRCPTASLDAAMSLVPSGCLFMVRTLWDDGKTSGYAVIQHYEPTETQGLRYDGESVAIAATPALALTAASLRAIAWSMTE